jgi:hypothetical protein
MELGVKEFRQAATFGQPLGSYVEEPQAFLKAHAKEPVLPLRKAPPYPILQGIKCGSHSVSSLGLALAL